MKPVLLISMPKLIAEGSGALIYTTIEVGRLTPPAIQDHLLLRLGGAKFDWIYTFHLVHMSTYGNLPQLTC